MVIGIVANSSRLEDQTSKSVKPGIDSKQRLHQLLSRMRLFARAAAYLLLYFVFANYIALALPFEVVFQGREKFDALVRRAESENWPSLPIGQRTAAVGSALVGTPYKSYTLEIDNRIEAPSVNLNGMDCWTFFEASLAFARMLSEPRENWTPE